VEEARNKLISRNQGVPKFIGSLFLCGLLTERIVHECLRNLLLTLDESDLNNFASLMTTVGKSIDYPKASQLMDAYFLNIEALSTNKAVSSRTRFKLRDLIDLRKNRWAPKRPTVVPKTIEEVHRDAESEKHNKAQQMDKLFREARSRDLRTHRVHDDDDEEEEDIPVPQKRPEQLKLRLLPAQPIQTQAQSQPTQAQIQPQSQPTLAQSQPTQAQIQPQSQPTLAQSQPAKAQSQPTQIQPTLVQSQPTKAQSQPTQIQPTLAQSQPTQAQIQPQSQPILAQSQPTKAQSQPTQTQIQSQSQPSSLHTQAPLVVKSLQVQVGTESHQKVSYPTDYKQHNIGKQPQVNKPPPRDTRLSQSKRKPQPPQPGKSPQNQQSERDKFKQKKGNTYQNVVTRDIPKAHPPSRQIHVNQKQSKGYTQRGNSNKDSSTQEIR